MKHSDWLARRAGLKSTPGSPGEGFYDARPSDWSAGGTTPRVTYPGKVTSRAESRNGGIPPRGSLGMTRLLVGNGETNKISTSIHEESNNRPIVARSEIRIDILGEKNHQTAFVLDILGT